MIPGNEQNSDVTTKACGRCGKWHTDVEEAEGKRFSCSEIKNYWANIRRKHELIFGHRALISREGPGRWICLVCKAVLLNAQGGS